MKCFHSKCTGHHVFVFEKKSLFIFKKYSVVLCSKGKSFILTETNKKNDAMRLMSKTEDWIYQDYGKDWTYQD